MNEIWSSCMSRSVQWSYVVGWGDLNLLLTSFDPLLSIFLILSASVLADHITSAARSYSNGWNNDWILQQRVFNFSCGAQRSVLAPERAAWDEKSWNGKWNWMHNLAKRGTQRKSRRPGRPLVRHFYNQRRFFVVARLYHLFLPLGHHTSLRVAAVIWRLRTPFCR